MVVLITVFEGMKGSWEALEVWHCEMPEESIGEGAASVAVDGPGLMESYREVEA